MNTYFIKSIKINKVRHLENLTIPLSETEKKHLILTGKNGSGKTSVLESIRDCLRIITDERPKASEKTELNISMSDASGLFKKYQDGEFIMAFFGASRKILFETPEGPKIFEFKTNYAIDENVNRNFLLYLLNMKTQKAFAQAEHKNTEIIDKIDSWFKKFEDTLKTLFEDKTLRLDFDFTNYNFYIITKDRGKCTLNQLSDGFSSVIHIVTDIMLKMEKKNRSGYDLEGIILIDEIETHLHVSLQKIILPFLTGFFPKAQFIVTTHSPFILNSIQDAVIFDLENKTIVQDLSAYSYDGIIENYFETDKYSTIIKTKVKYYETLLQKKELTENEANDKIELKNYLTVIPPELAPELSAKMTELKVTYGE